MRLIVELFAGDNVDGLRHIKQRRVGFGCGHDILSNIAGIGTGHDDSAAIFALAFRSSIHRFGLCCRCQNR